MFLRGHCVWAGKKPAQEQQATTGYLKVKGLVAVVPGVNGVRPYEANFVRMNLLTMSLVEMNLVKMNLVKMNLVNLNLVKMNLF